MQHPIVIVTGLCPLSSFHSSFLSLIPLFQPNPHKSALLVGFTYDNFPEEDRLDGTENDVKKIASILRHIFSFGDLVLLLGNSATYDALASQLDRFSGNLIFAVKNSY